MDFRRDCSACLAGAARGERHRRKSVHDAWVLYVDLLGPFAQGADEHGKVRYALTGILTVPDYTKVSEAIQESDDIASGASDQAAVGSDYDRAVIRGGVRPVVPEVPMSSLGPPPSMPLRVIEEEDEFEGYEPSDPGIDEENVMAMETASEGEPETEAEAQAVARANQRWCAAAAALQLQSYHRGSAPSHAPQQVSAKCGPGIGGYDHSP